jgi:hypothetical protein
MQVNHSSTVPLAYRDSCRPGAVPYQTSSSLLSFGPNVYRNFAWLLKLLLDTVNGLRNRKLSDYIRFFWRFCGCSSVRLWSLENGANVSLYRPMTSASTAVVAMRRMWLAWPSRRRKSRGIGIRERNHRSQCCRGCLQRYRFLFLLCS